MLASLIESVIFGNSSIIYNVSVLFGTCVIIFPITKLLLIPVEPLTSNLYVSFVFPIQTLPFGYILILSYNILLPLFPDSAVYNSNEEEKLLVSVERIEAEGPPGRLANE